MRTIHYVLCADKPLKNGTSPIDLIYQVSSQRRYYRTNIRLYPQSWDSDAQKTIYFDKKQAKKLRPEVHYDSFPTYK
ncbi:Arm DNA-binding domain-containing protein [Segetibacter koreensis]|uniref:Arm DNA-binding domain-containing protein n=1 Tax=Segetibacter koreensis TaxID=398037 RepID=UPI000360D68A|nr:Arm DNA-binding domain-containing protein [Segetibacter koreensis]